MRIATHKDLINAVTQAVLCATGKEMNAFARGLCFGYAATFVEALHAGNLSEFDARMRAQLNESAQARQQFFYGMAIHQFPFLFPDEFPQDKNLYFQNMCLTSRLTVGGGLRSLFHHAGCYDEQGFTKTLTVLHEITHLYQCRLSLILDAGKHAVAMYVSPVYVRVASASNPSEMIIFPFKTVDELAVLSAKIQSLLTVIPNVESNEKMIDRLVIRWQWICSRDDYLNLIPARNILRKHFYESQVPTPDLLSLPDKKNQTWIIAAIKAQDVSLIRQMIGVFPQLKNMHHDHMTLLTYAVFYGLLESMRALLQADCDPNAVDEYGYQPLYYAVNYHGTMEYVKPLLLFGADARRVTHKEKKPSLWGRVTELQSSTKRSLMQP
jgi:hypothetical protein